MGKPKALLPWKGKTFLAHAVDAAISAGVENCVVVIGAQASEIFPEVKRLKADSVVNENWRLGMGSSIKIGVAWIQKKYPEISGILIQLSDQPKIQGTALAKLLAEHEKNPDLVISANYDDSPGVPALFPRKMFSDILNIQDQEGAKKLLLKGALITLSIPEAREDIDTPEQFQSLSSGRTS
jgi:molybdenum cofactor cytidylyltransferase